MRVKPICTFVQSVQHAVNLRLRVYGDSQAEYGFLFHTNRKGSRH